MQQSSFKTKILCMRTLRSLKWALLLLFLFFESGEKKDITRLTRAQLVEERIAQRNHSSEVFNALELHHIGAGIWACQDPQLGWVILVPDSNGEHCHS